MVTAGNGVTLESNGAVINGNAHTVASNAVEGKGKVERERSNGLAGRSNGVGVAFPRLAVAVLNQAVDANGLPLIEHRP